MAISDASLAPPVRTQHHGRVLVVTVDNPPVNALGVDVRRGLAAAIDAAQADRAVDAVLIVGAGPNFIAGADIREFGQPAQPPALPEVCNRIEACSKPVVAAIHGAALGGGLEVALAAHYRLAVAGAKLGLPEVQLGLMPGAGGTQRAPRLIGAAAALDLMLSGRHIGADEARRLGLVDRVGASADAYGEGLAYAQELVAARAPVRRSRDAAALADRETSLAAVQAARADTAKKARGLFSPLKIVDAVEAAIDQPFDDGLRLERGLFLQCIDRPQRAGLIHAFFAEREVLKAPETRAAKPRPIASAGIVGGGTMGAGIAVAMLDAGLPVTMIERDDASLARGRAHVEKVYDGLVAKGRLSEAARAATLARFTGSTSYDALSQVDLVVEAVFEDMAVKKAVFAELDRVCKPGAVLATNTSYLDIDTIAASVSRPADVIGLHFFSPANVMKLLEIVVPSQVSADVVATGFALAKKLRKTPVRAGVCDGFIGNRILATYRMAADHLLEDGASPYQIDQAVREFGFAMGPFQVSDLAGGDIGWATRQRRAATRDPRARYVHIADRLCERGWFGQKTGRGWYLYPEGSRQGVEDPEVLAIIDVERAKAGITPRTFTNEEIVRRYLAAMINEGANVVHERIALRPLDVDFLLIDMTTPGVEVRPIVTLDGEHEVNEVFFTDVRVPIENLVGEENRGWTCAKYLLTYERTNIAGVGFSVAALERLKRIAATQLKNGRPLAEDPLFAARLARVEIDLENMKTTNLRVIAAVAGGGVPGAESSMLKIRGTQIRQELSSLIRRAMGPYAQPFVEEALEEGFDGEPVGPAAAASAAVQYFNNRKLSIFGGSNEIQRNIIAKAILGL